MTEPTPETLRKYAALFERMGLPTGATTAAARALRWQADEIERRDNLVNGGGQTRQVFASDT